MSIPIFTVDAFTEAPFAGNPAGVCLLDAPRDEVWMQHVAREMNLAETAFLVPREGGFDLRWFTPAVEMALCGHATLASAHVLWETGCVPGDAEARFLSKSGWLVARRHDGDIELDFPAKPETTVEAPQGLLEALDVSASYVGKNEFDYLVEVKSEAAVRALDPDLAQIATLPVRGVIVTAKAETAGWDFVSRFFAPAAGVPEDPVTGSAHCCLTPYWAKKLGKRDMVGRQLSARGGTVRVRLEGDRVMLGGHAVTVMKGALTDAVSPAPAVA